MTKNDVEHVLEFINTIEFDRKIAKAIRKNSKGCGQPVRRYFRISPRLDSAKQIDAVLRALRHAVNTHGG